MDTFTHGIVGALTGKALFAGRDVPARSEDGTWTGAQSSSTARVAILGCTIASIFPDIDIFAGPLAGNPLAIMEWHRNITHSVVMLPVWAALLAVISLPLARWLRWPRPSFAKLFVIYAAGIATHIFLDLTTSFGTMVWSPLNYSRPTWDWLFILDLTFTSIALVPQLAAWCYREPEIFLRRAFAILAVLIAGAFGAYVLAASAGYAFPMYVVGVVATLFALLLFLPTIRNTGFRWRRASWCRASLALLCVYIALAATLHRKALADVDQFAEAHHLAGEKLVAAPLPPTLTHWTGLIATPEGVWRTTFHEPGGVVEGTQFYSTVQPDHFVEEAKKLHAVQVYLWFSRFPVWHEWLQQGRTVVDISDVRFFREQEPDRNIQTQRPAQLAGLRTNASGFMFEVVFNNMGQVVSQGFKRPE